MNNYDLVNVKMGTQNHPRYSNGNCYPLMAFLTEWRPSPSKQILM